MDERIIIIGSSNLTLVALVVALIGGCAEPDRDDGDITPAACQSDAACLNGQMCMQGVCVPGDEDPSAESLGDDGPADDPSGPSSPGSATADPSGTDPSATAGPGTTAGPAPECEPSDDPVCAGTQSIEGCVDGEIAEYDCSDVCASEGWVSEGCDYSADLGHDACLCSDPPYGSCTSNADCSAETPTCVQFETGSMCSTSCGDDYDCPWPTDELSYPICGIPWDTYFCVVECSLGGECPEGTACYQQDNGNALCL